MNLTLLARILDIIEAAMNIILLAIEIFQNLF